MVKWFRRIVWEFFSECASVYGHLRRCAHEDNIEIASKQNAVVVDTVYSE